ncbi:protein translocase subunit SecDF [Bacillus solimangrovi]|uniref:Multifunctional fusion protein n=1 Tax=Bacillus solimangrovi TaxID=1305675 RepID=A0A1E5LBM9_9BACI|nr:protein translocase subunit SecDF [Bacillus solimangrovi]OEH91494.1 protein translocase subunit SecDF [Bacillus solimangrovi]
MVKKGRIIAFFLIVLLLGGTIGTTIEGVAKNIKLGLDLQGGFEVLYEVEPVEEGQVVDKELLLSTVSALNKRVNVLGVNEPSIQIEGDNRIRVQLAGVENQNEAREILSTQAKISFHDVQDNLVLDGTQLEEGGAAQSFNENNQPIVTLTAKNASDFGDATEHILSLAPNNLMVTWLDYDEEVDSYEQYPENDKIISVASVNQVLNTTNIMISGNFTVEEAKQLADLLNAGSLPVELKEIYSTSVGAQFGEKALEKTVYAGLIGIALIFLFMLFYYRLPGFIAVITLSVYIFLILQVFDWMNGVLTLPGIAAIILGVGMAVDANIITYERLKEELKVGKSVMSAFRAGNRRSLATILDANITTILAATVLFIYGTSSVKGFATMLIISILLSFITAVYGTRLLLGLWINSRILNKKLSYFGVKESEVHDISEGLDSAPISERFKSLDLIKHRKKFFGFSISMVIVGVGLLLTIGLNLGIDFASGTRVEVLANQPLNAEQVQSSFEAVDLEPNEVLISGTDNEIGVASFVGVLDKGEIANLKTHFNNEYGAEPSVSTVSPTVGKELARNAFIAVMIASVGIIIYVTIRFEFYFALAAIVALLHDAFFIIAAFSLLQFEVDITFIAAVLTIVGYSINDTIVTFDRIRENLQLKKRIKSYEDLAEVVNRSLLQTLARSINTILTVMFAAGALLIFGSESIRGFSFALLIGLVAGTYSSLFIAAQLWLTWKHKQLKKNGFKPLRKEKSDQPKPEAQV